jgi:hypothetical protein
MQPTLRWCGYIFTASPTGDRAIAYNPTTREEKSVELNGTKEQPLRIQPVTINPMGRPRLVGLHLQGPRITRVAVFDLQTGKWLPLDLDQPVRAMRDPSRRIRTGCPTTCGRTSTPSVSRRAPGTISVSRRFTMGRGTKTASQAPAAELIGDATHGDTHPSNGAGALRVTSANRHGQSTHAVHRPSAQRVDV